MKLVVKATIVIFIIFSIALSPTSTIAKTPNSKFYDFSEQLIDGVRKRPTTLYTNVRQQVRFDRLLRLKRSFLPRLFNTAKERVFK